MIRDLYFGLAIVLTVVAATFVAYRLKAVWSRRRAAWTLLAALAVGGSMSLAWSMINQSLIEAQRQEDDATWARVRGEIVARYPDIG